MSDPLDLPKRSFRLRSTMRFDGAPVNWNARSVIWSGSDRRYWARRAVGRVSAWLRRGHPRASSWRYRVHMWLFRCIDDRDRTYTRTVSRVRWLLNTTADVEARKAWTDARRYWQAREREKADRG